MIWSTNQNLDRPIAAPDGTAWFFLFGHGHDALDYVQRLFFWDEAKLTTGLVEWRNSETLHMRRIKDRMRRIATDANYRARFVRPLDFPIQRHW